MKVRHLRWMQEMPREVLAERLGFPVERLRRCESGALSFSKPELDAVASHLGVPLAFFDEAMNDAEQIGAEFDADAVEHNDSTVCNLFSRRRVTPAVA